MRAGTALCSNWWHHWLPGAEDDEAIHRFTDDLTLEGYSLEDTRAEVQRMIDGARAKGFGTELAQ